MTSNGKQFTVTREMLTAVAGISARFSKFAFVLFCYITNHLMTGPLGNSEFCFPRISMFLSTSSRETLRFSGNKIHCSPRDQSLSVNYIRWQINYKTMVLFVLPTLREKLSEFSTSWLNLVPRVPGNEVDLGCYCRSSFGPVKDDFCLSETILCMSNI